jgi:hypothetical protein
LAGILRPGNAGANPAAVLQQAMDQLIGVTPASGMEILVRADSGGATHDLVNQLRAFEIRFDLTKPVRNAIMAMPESAWVPAVTQAGEVREGAAVCQLTNLDLTAWPEGTRRVRWARCYSGAALVISLRIGPSAGWPAGRHGPEQGVPPSVGRRIARIGSPERRAGRPAGRGAAARDR